MYRCPLGRRFAAAAIGLVLAAAAVAGAAELPAPLAPFTARYALSNGVIRLGTTTVRLQPRAGGWLYQSTTVAEGLAALFVDEPIVDTVRLVPHNGAPRPVVYRHEGEDESVRVVFDWAAGVARVRQNGERRTVALKPGTRDPFSAILRVMRALAAGKRAVAFPGIDEDRERERLRFKATGRARVRVPLGTYETVRVQRVRDDGRATITWLAPELGWLPVRVEQYEDGELVARLALTALNGEEAPSRTRPRIR